MSGTSSYNLIKSKMKAIFSEAICIIDTWDETKTGKTLEITVKGYRNNMVQFYFITIVVMFLLLKPLLFLSIQRTKITGAFATYFNVLNRLKNKMKYNQCRYNNIRKELEEKSTNREDK